MINQSFIESVFQSISQSINHTMFYTFSVARFAGFGHNLAPDQQSCNNAMNPNPTELQPITVVGESGRRTGSNTGKSANIRSS